VGCLVIIFTLWHFQPRNSQPLLQLACDGKLALHQVFVATQIQLTEHQNNLISAVCNWLVQLQYTIKWTHVKGHQDETIKGTLSWDALLNIEADVLDKQALINSNGRPVVHQI